MPLDPKKIEQLMNKPRRGGGVKKNAAGGQGPLLRNYQTWFKLQTHMLSADGELLHCENENCEDPRRENNPEYKGIMVAEIDGVNMCRFCFLAGWLTDQPTEQLSMTDDND